MLYKNKLKGAYIMRRTIGTLVGFYIFILIIILGSMYQHLKTTIDNIEERQAYYEQYIDYE